METKPSRLFVAQNISVSWALLAQKCAKYCKSLLLLLVHHHHYPCSIQEGLFNQPPLARPSRNALQNPWWPHCFARKIQVITYMPLFKSQFPCDNYKETHPSLNFNQHAFHGELHRCIIVATWHLQTCSADKCLFRSTRERHRLPVMPYTYDCTQRSTPDWGAQNPLIYS